MGDARGEIRRAFFMGSVGALIDPEWSTEGSTAATAPGFSSRRGPGRGGTGDQGVIAPPDQGLEAGSWHRQRDTSWHNEVCPEMVPAQPSSSEIPAVLLTSAQIAAKSPTNLVYSAGVIGLSPGSSTTSLNRSTTSGAL